ncbi:MAG TPA: alginate lyase family protein [Mobilitalea sp.]|nr:alginate lyase family protein [Mobilitalea sp.]
MSKKRLFSIFMLFVMLISFIQIPDSTARTAAAASVKLDTSKLSVGYYSWAANGNSTCEFTFGSANLSTSTYATSALFDSNTGTDTGLSKDCYLYLDLGTGSVSLTSIDLTMKSSGSITGSWKIYGSNSLTNNAADWTVLATPTGLTPGATISVTLTSSYRYLLIGGSATLFNTWIHTWDQLSEIALYGTGTITPASYPFAHPGVLQTASGLKTMKDMVASQTEPWYSTYLQLQSTINSYGTINASDYMLTSITRSNSGSYNEMRLAAAKVYNLGLMYYISGNSTYAAGARTIMMKYASIFTGVGTSGDTSSVYDTNLDVGVVALKFCAAAEILRYSYSGWSISDTNSLIAMFNKCTGGTAVSMYQLMSNAPVLATYDMDNICHGHAAILRQGSMAYAVFAEDTTLSNLVKNDFKANSTAYYTNQGGYAWQKKPDKSQGANGYSLLYNYNASTGQSKESDRDQAHALVNLAAFTTIAQIAWCQGDNSLYEFNSRLLLKAINFSTQYSLGYDISSYITAYPWDHHSSLGITTYDRGRTVENMYAAAYNYYKFSSGAASGEYTYLSKYVNHPLYAKDKNSYDIVGFGALTFSISNRAADYTNAVTAVNNAPHWLDVGVNNMLDGTYNIFGEYATSFVSGSFRDYSKLRLYGTNAIAAFPYTAIASTGTVNIRYSSTGIGTLEISTVSYNGSLYGQPEDYAAGACNGNRGTLLATIPIANTGSLTSFTTTALSNNILNTSGTAGGTIAGNYMIFVVFKGANSNTSMDLLYIDF